MNGQTTGPSLAEIYDDVLSWQVPSRSDPHVKYHCELGDYRGNGRCDCEDFKIRFEGLLAKGYTPERALAEGRVKIRDYQVFPYNALRCFHLIEARNNLDDVIIKAFQTAAAKNRA